jgi:ribosomal-protein-alanine N-acetyltransferase
LTSQDTNRIHHIWSDPQVRKYLWDDEVISGDHAASVIQSSTCLFRERAFGLWGVFPLGTDDLIGFCGFWYFRQPPELELLFGLRPAYWGQGLATEAARAIIRFGFEELGFDRIAASTDAPNSASIAVMERIGMSFDRRATVDGRDTLFYSVCRRTFASDDSPYQVHWPPEPE